MTEAILKDLVESLRAVATERAELEVDKHKCTTAELFMNTGTRPAPPSSSGDSVGD